MPVARYFLFVGGVLLALLFVVDAFVPPQAVVASNAAPSIDRNVVRIRSDQKLPERVVYDTSLPTIVPPASKVQVAAAPPAAGAPTSPPRRACATPLPSSSRRKLKKPEPQAQRKRKIAKSHANPPMRLAQQQHAFGFFGNSTWKAAPGRGAVAMSLTRRLTLPRQLRNLVGKTVVAGQPLVLFFQETAIIDALGGRRLRLRLRREDGVVAAAAVPWWRRRCPGRPAASGRRIWAPLSCRRPPSCRRRASWPRPDTSGLPPTVGGGLAGAAGGAWCPWANAAAGYRIASARIIFLMSVRSRMRGSPDRSPPKWRARRDSNSRPSESKSDALSS